MGKYNYFQNSISSGELSPKLRGQVGTKEHAQGAEILSNMMTMPSGGATRRPGTRFEQDLTDYFIDPLIVPFTRSRILGYNIVMETSEYTAPETDSYPNATGAGNYDGVDTFTMTAGTHPWQTGDVVTFQAPYFNFTAYTDSNTAVVSERVWYVIRVDSTNFQLAESATLADNAVPFQFGPTITGLSIPQFWKALNLMQVYNNEGSLVQTKAGYGFSNSLHKYQYNWTQSGDVIFIAHQSGEFELRTLKRTDVDTFDILFYADEAKDRSTGNNLRAVPYNNPNVNLGLKLKPSASTGNITLSMEDASGNPVPYFTNDFTGGAPQYWDATVQNVRFTYWDGSAGNYAVLRCRSFLTNPKSFVAAAVTTGVGTSNININTHAFVDGDLLTYTSTANVIEPLLDNENYYVIVVDANNIQLASSLAEALAGTEIDFTDVGSGNQSLTVEKSSEILAEVELGTANTLARDTWEESSWSCKNGHPKTVVIIEQRLVIGGVPAAKDSLYLSNLGNFWFMYDNYMGHFIAGTDFVSSDAFQITIASAEYNEITWMKAHNSLQIGTTGSEYVCTGGAEAISRFSISVKPQTQIGGKYVRPVTADRYTLFVSGNGKTVRAFVYNDTNGSFIGKNVSVLADHLVYHGATDRAPAVFEKLVTHHSRDITWILTSNEELIGLTWHENTEVIAWHKHTIGGTDVNIKDISTLTNSEGTYENLWAIVERTINTETKLYLEFMGGDFEADTLYSATAVDGDRPYFSDSCVRETPAGTTVSNLEHLEGEEVVVLGDGNYKGTFTVASGEIELSSAVAEAIVGLAYTPELLTTKIEVGFQEGVGVSQGDMTRIHRAVVRFYKTGQARVGVDSSTTDPAEKVADASDIYTGDDVIDFSASPERQGQAYITSSEPKPITILGVGMKGVSYAQ